MYTQDIINAVVSFQRVLTKEFPERDYDQVAKDLDRVLPGISRQLTMLMLAGDLLPEGHDKVVLVKEDDTHNNIAIIKKLRSYFRLSLKDGVEYAKRLGKEVITLEGPVAGIISKDEFVSDLRELGVRVVGFNYNRLSDDKKSKCY